MKLLIFRILAIAIVSVAVASCKERVEISVDENPPIFPDFIGVTFPQNIAPLNFGVRNADSFEATFVFGAEQHTFSASKSLDIPLSVLKNMLKKSADNSLSVSVSAVFGDTLKNYRPFDIFVSSDSIDRFLSYRLIEPGFEVWDRVCIVERDVESFDETVLSKGTLLDNVCMNCHTYARGGRSFVHVRGAKGGTIVNDNGRLQKLNLRPDGSAGAATYGELHPNGRFAIFSTNTIIPALHSQNENRLEVFDTESDLVVVDLQNHTIERPTSTTTVDYLETFPAFSADGEQIFFCRAPFAELGKTRYSIVSAPFDAATGAVGDSIEIVWNADEHCASASFPKASPDGRWLLLTTSREGTFPIWHREADLALLDLRTGKEIDLTAVNDTCSDSYHSWSSSSRWFVFASKRVDGVYGRPYFCHISSDGEVSKPFVLPQQSAEYYDFTLLSFNIPELSPVSANFDAWRVRDLIDNADAIPFELR